MPAQNQQEGNQRTVAAPPESFEDDSPPHAGPSKPIPRDSDIPERKPADTPVTKSTWREKSILADNKSPPITSSPLLVRSAGGNHFSDEEKELLLDVYEAAMSVDEDQVIDAWAAWASEVRTIERNYLFSGL